MYFIQDISTTAAAAAAAAAAAYLGHAGQQDG
jgi:hypothetical protein